MTTPNADKNVERSDHSDIAGENVKCENHSGEQFGCFLKQTHNYHTVQKLYSQAVSPQERKRIFTQKPVQECS